MEESWTGFHDYSANVFSLPPLIFDYADKEPIPESSNHARTVSAEPIASSKVTIHHRGSQSLDDTALNDRRPNARDEGSSAWPSTILFDIKTARCTSLLVSS